MVNGKKFDATFWGMAFLLWLFWIVITASLQIQELCLGALLAVLLAWFNSELFFRSDERSPLNWKTARLFLRYAFHLTCSIVTANIQVAALVLNPKMPISPGIVRFSVPLEKSFNRVLLANSITLTPGTLTMLVENDDFVVHALTRENAVDVAQWELIGELAAIETSRQKGD